MSMRRLSVVVADDSALYRQMLQNVLQRIPGVEVVGVATDGVEALARIAELRPDVITLDVQMPRLDGLGVLRELRSRGSRTKAIMVSSLTAAGALFSPATTERVGGTQPERSGGEGRWRLPGGARNTYPPPRPWEFVVAGGPTHVSDGLGLTVPRRWLPACRERGRLARCRQPPYHRATVWQTSGRRRPMILDSLPQWRRYTALNARLAKAFAFLEQATPDIADGRHEIDGDAVFALVQRYQTRPAAGPLEAHRRYVDVQYMLRGREVIQWAPLERLTTVARPYDEQQDAGLFAANAEVVPVPVSTGQFMILFPEDAHAPCCVWAEPEPVVKIVVKVAIG